MRKWTNFILALAISSTCLAGGILPCQVYRRGLTNEQIDGILAKHPDAQLRISAQDWRGMRYQLTRFQNMTNYVEEIGNSNDCARVLLRLHDTAEDLSRTNSTLRASLSQAVKDMEAWRDAATEYEADAKTSQEIRKAVKRAEKNLSKIVKTIEQAKKKASNEDEAALYDLLLEILTPNDGKEE